MTKQILVADDERGIRMLLQELLSDEGCSVTTSETGREALDYLYAYSFDLLILDYKLPLVDGADLLKQLETDRITVPAIVMSGLSEDIGAEIADIGNVRKIVAKPFDVQEIRRLVNSIFE